MRLPRQPTIKTLLLLTAVYALQLAAYRAWFTFPEHLRPGALWLIPQLVFWSFPVVASLVLSTRKATIACLVVASAYEAASCWYVLDGWSWYIFLSDIGVPDGIANELIPAFHSAGTVQSLIERTITRWAHQKEWSRKVFIYTPSSALSLLLYVLTAFLSSKTTRARSMASHPSKRVGG